MRMSFSATLRPPGGVSSRKHSWAGRPLVFNIALLLLYAAFSLPYVVVKGDTEAISASAKDGAADVVILDSPAEVAQPTDEYKTVTSTDGNISSKNVNGAFNVSEMIEKYIHVFAEHENISEEAIDDLLSADKETMRKLLLAMIRERDELRVMNKDLNAFIKYKMEKNALLKQQIDRLERNVSHLKEDALKRNLYAHDGKYEAHERRGIGLLDAITIRDLAHVIFVLHRAPLMILRHHFKLYADIEDAIVHTCTLSIPKLFNRGLDFYNDVLVKEIDQLFSTSISYIESLSAKRKQISHVQEELNKVIDEHMAMMYNIEEKLWDCERIQNMTLRKVATMLYWRDGHRHCLHWWYALTKGISTAIKGDHTAPMLILAMYGSVLDSIFNRINIYVLWMACFVTFFFLDQAKRAEHMHNLVKSLKDLYGPLVVSPFSVKLSFNCCVDALGRHVKYIDSKLEHFYMYLTGLYSDFSGVYPNTLRERIGILLAILFVMLAALLCLQCAMRCIIRALELSLLGGKRLKFTYNGYGKIENWYDHSFLRWSIDLLHPKQNTEKTQTPLKARRRVKHLPSQAMGEDSGSTNVKKSSDQTGKPNTIWHGASRRNRG